VRAELRPILILVLRSLPAESASFRFEELARELLRLGAQRIGGEPVPRFPDESHRLVRGPTVGVPGERGGRRADAPRGERRPVVGGAEAVAVGHALAAAERSEPLRAESREIGGGEREPEVAGRVRVREDPVGTLAAEVEVTLARRQERAGLLRLLADL